MSPHHQPSLAHAEFRFYEELNDFLPPAQRKLAFAYAFSGTPSVKDAIEAIGVPHTEVDLVIVDGDSVDFAHRLQGGERIAVYPVFERLDITPLVRLRAKPLRDTRFVLDVHLGKLARHLRLLGFDTLYRNDYDDATIVSLSLAETRIILTRDTGILKHGAVTHGHWVRATNPRQQLREILRAFDLARSARPFTRCLLCNGMLEKVTKDAVAEQLPSHVRMHGEEFARCRECAHVFWPGSHYERLRKLVDDVLDEAKA